MLEDRGEPWAARTLSRGHVSQLGQAERRRLFHQDRRACLQAEPGQFRVRPGRRAHVHQVRLARGEQAGQAGVPGGHAEVGAEFLSRPGIDVHGCH